MIKLEDVWKTYNLGEISVHALQGINIAIREGEFVAIRGPSGSGKSTTFNLIGCLDFPTKGKVVLDGRDIAKLNEDSLARIRGKKIGFVFQTFNLIPSLQAIENVMLPMTFQNLSESKRAAIAKELLMKVGLSHRVTHRPNQLSGGERQRVAIARALANDPELILADEPTGNLDSKTGESIMKLFMELHNQGKTIVMVTHEKGIADHAERTIFIKDGKVAI
ncbi:ABC transporter ATP-binding protein [Candidatus Woesearchaeota archaeon]|nr:ABC transporter ATP-binding protein [Candidatus Woesearchaeota archaeon]